VVQGPKCEGWVNNLAPLANDSFPSPTNDIVSNRRRSFELIISVPIHLLYPQG